MQCLRTTDRIDGEIGELYLLIQKDILDGKEIKDVYFVKNEVDDTISLIGVHMFNKDNVDEGFLFEKYYDYDGEERVVWYHGMYANWDVLLYGFSVNFEFIVDTMGKDPDEYVLSN